MMITMQRADFILTVVGIALSTTLVTAISGLLLPAGIVGLLTAGLIVYSTVINPPLPKRGYAIS